MQYSTAVAQVMKKETFSEDVDVLCQLATNQANKETEQSIVRQVVATTVAMKPCRMTRK